MTKQRLYLVKYKAKLTSNGYETVSREVLGPLPDDPEEHMVLMLNKRGAGDCTEQELKELWRWALEMLDLEHVIETLKLRLWDFLPVDKLVQEHNRKCVEKRYYDPRQPELKLAG